MYIDYIKKLETVLHSTEFYSNQGTIRMDSYEEGIRMLVECFVEVKRNGNTVFFIGNGGSAAIASHMTVDYLKNGRIRTHSMLDSAVLTCLGNDYGYEFVFSEQLKAVCNQNDLLVAISSSGNSDNIVKAVETARACQAKIITLTGFKQTNRVLPLGDYSIYVPLAEYGIVESIHNLILQQVVDEIIEDKLKG